MRPPVQRSQVSLDRLLSVCDLIYARDGFVTWTEVGKTLGISRQAVQLRLRAAIEKGDLTSDAVEKYQSIASRQAVARERGEKRVEDEHKYRRSIRFTPENLEWLQAQADERKVRIPDIINGLVTKARLS
jgi:predicted transcriptional regulator